MELTRILVLEPSAAVLCI